MCATCYRPANYILPTNNWSVTRKVNGLLLIVKSNNHRSPSLKLLSAPMSRFPVSLHDNSCFDLPNYFSSYRGEFLATIPPISQTVTYIAKMVSYLFIEDPKMVVIVYHKTCSIHFTSFIPTVGISKFQTE